jgi:transcriptional regulator with XRE-family HTH domain
MLRRRIELGWSQKEAAHRIDVSDQFLGQVENEKGKLPSLDTFLRICLNYEVSADWLLELSNPPAPKPPLSADEQFGVVDNL